MSFSDAPTKQFAYPARQIVLMLLALTAVGVGGFFMTAQIQTIFFANVYLNAFIGFVFVVGVLATFWQIAQIISAVRWLRNLQSGFHGHEFVQPPSLVTSMSMIQREGRLRKRLATSATRSILDSISERLEESRDITRYISNLLIFLGLLGTFWGLSLTVPAVVDTIKSLAPQDGDTSDVSIFDNLMSGLESQLGGMGTAFASSLVGLAGSLVVGLLELFAGHGQNRFYRELEEYLSAYTRLGMVSEGEGPESALIALLERVDEGLERTTDFAERAEEARIQAEERLAAAADVVGKMAAEIERERTLVAQLVSEMRDARELEAGRDHATLTVLKRIDQGQNQLAAAQQAVAEVIERMPAGSAVGGAVGGGFDTESRNHIRSLDKQLRAMADDVAVGRHETLTALRAELRALTNMIDMRTRETGQ
ncbi:MAG: biopolymer transporter ExbB [Pseudomonadota bacterium]